MVPAVLLVGLAAIVSQALPAWSAEGEVIIRATGLEPHVLRAVAGQRVNFVKRVKRPVHVEFGVDPSAHQVFQMPATGPIWAIFHRPGTHPYVVHIYDGKTIALHGLIEVVEDPARPWGPGTCGAVVQEVCIEP
jgi:hypothetical protein